MAASVDVTVGTKAQSGSATASLVTGNPVAAGALIVFGVGYFSGGTPTASITTAAGLTWTRSTQTHSGSINAYLFSAYAAAGLASGSTITWTSSAGAPDWLIGGMSFLGAETTPTILASNGTAASAATWSGGSLVAGEVNIGVCCVFEDGNGTLTWGTDAPATERIDFNSAGQTEAFTLAYDLAGASTATITGTSSASVSHVTRASAFKIAAGGGGPADLPPRRTLLGVGR